MAAEPADDRVARLEKRVADLERQREASQWDDPPAPAAPAPSIVRSPEPDRRDEIRALVKAAVDEALSAQRAEWERRERAPVTPPLPPIMPVAAPVKPVRWSEAPRAPAPWGEVEVIPSIAPARPASVPVAAAIAPPVPRIEIPAAHEPLGFDIPDGLDGSARRRRLAWKAFLFLFVLVAGAIGSMLASRNR